MRLTVIPTAAAGILLAGLVLAQDRLSVATDDEPQPLPIEAELPNNTGEVKTISPRLSADDEAAFSDRNAPTVAPRIRKPTIDDLPVPVEGSPASSPLTAPDDQYFPSNSTRRRPPHTSSDPFDDRSWPAQAEPGRSNSAPNQAAQQVNSLTKRLGQVPRNSRASVAAELEVALNRLFDARTQMRESQIADLERRIETLRAQLRERVSRKQEIVQLRLQTLINEANGLAF